MFATPTRGHDALWHTHSVLLHNDDLVTAARRGGRRRQIAKNVADIPAPAPVDPAEAAAAVRTAHAIAARTGMDASALHEVLEALGLVQSAEDTSPKPPAKTKYRTGECTQCEQTIHLRKDGTLVAHTRSRAVPPGTPHCPGTHIHPRPEATR